MHPYAPQGWGSPSPGYLSSEQERDYLLPSSARLSSLPLSSNQPLLAYSSLPLLSNSDPYISHQVTSQEGALLPSPLQSSALLPSPPVFDNVRKKRTRSLSPSSGASSFPPRDSRSNNNNNSYQSYNVDTNPSGQSLAQAAIIIEGKKLQRRQLTPQEKLLDSYYNQIKPSILASTPSGGLGGPGGGLDGYGGGPTLQQDERLNQIQIDLQQINNQIHALQQEAMALQQEEGAIRELLSKGRGGGLLDSQGGGFITTEVHRGGPLGGHNIGGPGGPGLLGHSPGVGGPSYPGPSYSGPPYPGPPYPNRDNRIDVRDLRGGFPSPSYPPTSLSPGPSRGPRKGRGGRGRGNRGK